MSSDQDALWVAESGAWYRRNREALASERLRLTDPVLRLIERLGLTPTSLADVGCSTGWRTAYLIRKFGCRGVGVDLSEEALAEGRLLYPYATLRRASATDLPIKTASVDLCVCAFLCHCLARESLLRAVSEVDRVLAPGGTLVLADFAPDSPAKRAWAHREGLWTYKLPDAGGRLFEDTACYRPLDALYYDHDDPAHPEGEGVPAERRAVVVALKKEERYLVQS